MTQNRKTLHISDQLIEHISNFVYLGSVIDETGGTDKGVAEIILKAKRAFSLLNPVWHSTIYSNTTKKLIFNSKVKSVLLYGCETWKITQPLIKKLQSFVYKCLRIFWPNVITNRELWNNTKRTRLASTNFIFKKQLIIVIKISNEIRS